VYLELLSLNLLLNEQLERHVMFLVALLHLRLVGLL
jgi:hypothetical protein